MSCSREPVGHWEKQGGQQVSTRVQENKAKSPTSHTLVIWPQASSYSGPVPLLEAQWNHPLPRVFGRFKWETEIMAVVIIIDHCILRGAGCCAVLCLVAQSCPTLCDPMDCSPPGSSVRGILQARILEWVATPSSRGSSHPGTGPMSLALQVDSLLSESPGKSYSHLNDWNLLIYVTFLKHSHIALVTDKTTSKGILLWS